MTIAGTDSGGGAGVPADIKTISACGCYAECAITAVTVQNTLGVTGVHDIPAEIIKAQIKAVLDDIGADSIKIGMLSKKETVDAVADSIRNSGVRNIVLDPVMVSTSGHSLLLPEAVEALKFNLIPLATIITPNIPEAEVLLGRKISDQSETEDCARELSKIGNNSVLLKAGHFNDDALFDVLYNAETGKVTKFEARRIESKNTHGTGCTLSSALASFLAQGLSLELAVSNAKGYIDSAIRAGADYVIGNGHGPVKHFWKYW